MRFLGATAQEEVTEIATRAVEGFIPILLAIAATALTLMMVRIGLLLVENVMRSRGKTFTGGYYGGSDYEDDWDGDWEEGEYEAFRARDRHDKHGRAY